MILEIILFCIIWGQKMIKENKTLDLNKKEISEVTSKRLK